MPMGIDFNYWSALAQQQEGSIWYPFLSKMPFVLSVDNADYTQGITNRLDAINRFFERYPQWRGKLIFLQVQERGDPGTPILERYWERCRKYSSSIAGLWTAGDWRPMAWSNTTLSRADLALLYRQASVMLVNPIKDGLNLAAKEFIACQGSNPGVLALSKGAGAWQEFGDCAVPVDPHDPERMAEAINAALTLGQGEKALRMGILKERLQNGGLALWWHCFTNMLEGPITMRHSA